MPHKSSVCCHLRWTTHATTRACTRLLRTPCRVLIMSRDGRTGSDTRAATCRLICTPLAHAMQTIQYVASGRNNQIDRQGIILPREGSSSAGGSGGDETWTPRLLSQWYHRKRWYHQGTKTMDFWLWSHYSGPTRRQAFPRLRSVPHMRRNSYSCGSRTLEASNNIPARPSQCPCPGPASNGC